MILNPVRLFRRWRRLRSEAMEEVRLLRRRHGEDALAEAMAKLNRPDLNTWGRNVLRQTVALLRKDVV